MRDGCGDDRSVFALVCLLSPDTVQRTRRYKDRMGKKSQDFESIIARFGMEDFIEISAELKWISSALVSDERKQSCTCGV